MRGTTEGIAGGFALPKTGGGDQHRDAAVGGIL